MGVLKTFLQYLQPLKQKPSSRSPFQMISCGRSTAFTCAIGFRSSLRSARSRPHPTAVKSENPSLELLMLETPRNAKKKDADRLFIALLPWMIYNYFILLLFLIDWLHVYDVAYSPAFVFTHVAGVFFLPISRVWKPSNVIVHWCLEAPGLLFSLQGANRGNRAAPGRAGREVARRTTRPGDLAPPSGTMGSTSKSHEMSCVTDAFCDNFLGPLHAEDGWDSWKKEKGFKRQTQAVPGECHWTVRPPRAKTFRPGPRD